jgi:hypothetical protein
MLTSQVTQQVSLLLGEKKRDRESLPSRGSEIVIDLSAAPLCVRTARESQEKGYYASVTKITVIWQLQDKLAVSDLD